MAEPQQPQQPQIRPHGQQPLATAIQKLQDLFSERGLLIAQVLAVVMLVPLGGVLLLLTGLTLAGTLIGLAVTAPLLVLFSPIIVPVALTIGLLVSGLLTSVAFGVTALSYFKWMENYLRRIRMRSPVPPASSTSEIGNQYYVFLSFRGSDTRKGFVDHLYHRLKDVGLRFHPNFVFRDDDKLPYGNAIDANLISAIKHSKVSIPVISPTYASSQWCLRELIQIMECNKRGEQTVLPVLFKVTPKDVRHLRGSFGDAFRRHKHYFSEEVKQQGREALKKATDSRVFESEIFANGYEAELVNKLVENVMRKQQEAFQPRLPEKLVGFDDHVAEVMKLADPDSTDIRIIGIYGIGGIGKTTLAKIIYKKLFDKFKCHSFLKDIREGIKQKGIEHVQSQLISNILNLHDYQVYNADTAISIIQSSFNTKKVLILLDDVDNKDHLANLIGDCSFMPGSRIIVTCRDKATWDFKYAYPLKEMDSKDSLLLFSRYAFEEKPIPKELATLSRNIVDTTGGLPLALEVIGLILKTKEDKRDWEEMLQQLRRAPNEKVQEKLRISYDTLESKEQQMFLDIACFFIGTDKSMASYLWEGPDMYPRSALAKMIGRSLIKYDDNNELRMHDQLRNLGKDIARQEHKKRWLCSRLWDEEAMTVLGRKDDNECIEALRLDEDGSREFMKQESFKRMPILKFLHGSAVVFAGDFERSLSELRWLKWERCPDSFEATKVDLKKLLILDLSCGYISHAWRGWRLMKMERLKVLNLSWCSELTSTPDLSAFENLERLILENCENLEKIDPSIRNVKRLISLNLRYCGSLKELPAELGELKELKEIVVDETDIQEIPPCIGSLQELTMLSAIGCHLLTQIPSSISHLVNLTTLNLNTCKKLQELPDSFQAGGKLQRLSLVRCYMLKQIPSSIGELGDLVELDLSSTRIKELPKSIEKLNNLKILRISNGAIEKIPSAIGKLNSLQELDASGCHKLKGQILPDAGGLSSLSTLRLGSAKISGLPENLHKLSTLKHLDLLYCSELQSLPKPPSSLSSLQLTCRSPKLPLLSRLSHLDKLTLYSCKFLESIPELPSGLRKLRVCKCPELKTLPNLSNLKSLLELELLQCYGLMEFSGLEALESLRKLDLSTSTELSNLDDFEDLESLRYLDLQSYNGEADYLSEIRGLGKLKSLEVLNISARKRIKELDLSKSEHLKQLIVKNCENLVKICCHNKIEPLEQFETDGCKSLTKLPDSLARDRSRFQREKIAKS